MRFVSTLRSLLIGLEEEEEEEDVSDVVPVYAEIHASALEHRYVQPLPNTCNTRATQNKSELRPAIYVQLWQLLAVTLCGEKLAVNFSKKTLSSYSLHGKKRKKMQL